MVQYEEPERLRTQNDRTRKNHPIPKFHLRKIRPKLKYIQVPIYIHLQNQLPKTKKVKQKLIKNQV